MSKDAPAPKKGPQQLLTKDVDPCPRCGNGHNSLVFKPLQRPFGRANFWCPCPDTKEPIMASVTIDVEASCSPSASTPESSPDSTPVPSAG